MGNSSTSCRRRRSRTRRRDCQLATPGRTSRPRYNDRVHVGELRRLTTHGRHATVALLHRHMANGQLSRFRPGSRHAGNRRQRSQSPRQGRSPMPLRHPQNYTDERQRKEHRRCCSTPQNQHPTATGLNWTALFVSGSGISLEFERVSVVDLGQLRRDPGRLNRAKSIKPIGKTTTSHIPVSSAKANISAAKHHSTRLIDLKRLRAASGVARA